MAMRIQLPGYSRLSPKQRQYANMALGGTAMLLVVLAVSGMIGGPDTPNLPPKELPKARPIAGAPGAQLDAKDAWMGSAGKDLAQLRDQLKQRDDQIVQLAGDLKTTRDQVAAELQALRERGYLNTTPAQPPGSTLPPLLPPMEADVAARAAGRAKADVVQPPEPGVGQTGPTAANAPLSFPVQQPDKLPAPQARALAAAAYPPGSPMGGGMGQAKQDAQGAAAVAAAPPPALMRVALSREAAAPAAAASGAGKPARTLKNFLPVGFTRAVLLGGLAAPTGGQAQNNPVPVLLRLADLSVLPNGYRAQVKDCLVIGEGYGDHSSERAYIRATLLSCVLHDGQVLEMPIKGSVFGEDGMNGVMGKLVTKQGAILGNALLSGIAAGIGQGVAQASQTTTTTALGTVSTTPSDTNSILRQGLGTGVGRALDRLAQYYINLAERTFPVVEVLPGRIVDVVLQQGIAVDAPLAGVGSSASYGPNGPNGQYLRDSQPPSADRRRAALLSAARHGVAADAGAAE